MHPSGIDSDLYNYHLKHLLKQGYIEKSDKQYLLTNKGRKFLVDLAPLRFGLPPRLKIAAMCLVLRKGNSGLEVLYQRRLREPHIGSVTMVAGGLKRGEGLVDAARRRLQEESGLLSEPSWVGTLRKVRTSPEDNNPWSDITYHICASFNPEGETVTTKYGQHIWFGLEEAAELERTQVVGSPFLGDFLSALAKDNTVLKRGFYHEEYTDNDIW